MGKITQLVGDKLLGLGPLTCSHRQLIVRLSVGYTTALHCTSAQLAWQQTVSCLWWYIYMHIPHHRPKQLIVLKYTLMLSCYCSLLLVWNCELLLALAVCPAGPGRNGCAVWLDANQCSIQHHTYNNNTEKHGLQPESYLIVVIMYQVMLL